MNAVAILETLGTVTIEVLPIQEIDDSVNVLEVHCCPGVFPVGSYKPKSLKVYSDKNMKNIFKRMREQSGWAPIASSIDNCVLQILGPPGVGKMLPSCLIDLDLL